MKAILIACAGLFLFANAGLFAQTDKQSLVAHEELPKLTEGSSLTNSISGDFEDNNVVIVKDIAAVNPLVLGIFSKKFPDATAILWRKYAGKYEASFLVRGDEYRSVFTPKGKFSYAIGACKYESLPNDARKIVSTHFKGYRIFNAQKIIATTTSYQLVLESDKEFITIRTDGDEWDEVATVKKPRWGCNF